MIKKGFTLVELMVVIIVMGLLAAIGVPKLTGVIAKSRATEVQPAAATYVKLQKAFIAEKGGVGTWKKIGYAGPGKKTLSNGVTSNRTQYFDYSASDEITSTIKPNFTTTLGEGKVGWIAENLGSLNECAAGNKWIVKIYAVNDTTVEYKMESDFASSCSMLVPNWNQSDFGVTFGEITAELKPEDPPEGVVKPTTPSESYEEEEDTELLTAKQCAKNGWLQGNKSGWQCKHPETPTACDSERNVCFDLRQKYFTEGKLSCAGNDKGVIDGIEVCNEFVYTALGYAELFTDGKKVVCESLKDVNDAKNGSQYCAGKKESYSYIFASECKTIGVSKGGIEYCIEKGTPSVNDDSGDNGSGDSDNGENGSDSESSNSNLGSGSSSSATASCDGPFDSESNAKKCCGENDVACSSCHGNSCASWVCWSKCSNKVNDKKCGSNKFYNFCNK